MINYSNYMTTELREKGKSCLLNVLNIENNVDILEKWIYDISSDDKDYKRIIFQTTGDILKKVKLKDVLENIKSNKCGYNHVMYTEIASKIEEQNEFIKNPFINIEKGVIQCKKCKSERVFSYSKQTRSGDESTSVFCECVECGSKWRIN